LWRGLSSNSGEIRLNFPHISSRSVFSLSLLPTLPFYKFPWINFEVLIGTEEKTKSKKEEEKKFFETIEIGF
jgi:hypothetical protein